MTDPTKLSDNELIEQCNKMRVPLCDDELKEELLVRFKAMVEERDIAINGLDLIANIITRLAEDAKKEGKILDGLIAVQLSHDADYLRGIASDTLAKINKQI